MTPSWSTAGDVTLIKILLEANLNAALLRKALLSSRRVKPLLACVGKSDLADHLMVTLPFLAVEGGRSRSLKLIGLSVRLSKKPNKNPS